MCYKIQASVSLSGCPKRISKLRFLFGYIYIFFLLLWWFHFNSHGPGWDYTGRKRQRARFAFSFFHSSWLEFNCIFQSMPLVQTSEVTVEHLQLRRTRYELEKIPCDDCMSSMNYDSLLCFFCCQWECDCQGKKKNIICIWKICAHDIFLRMCCFY